MRFTAGIALSAVVLAVAGAAGVVGSWSVGAAAVMVLIAGVSGAIALEARDLEAVRGLAGPALDDDEGTTAVPLGRAA